ncbi:MAG: HigA family addiction module antitoxin [Lachnospiraceae bacterium]|nr:HigA family addiction module antitoxin [Lachnospiraceae bacterium]
MARSRSYIATPPGATIKEQLNDRGMSQKEFAARMDMSEKHISRLINGDVQLTPDCAVRLEMVLGIPAEFWSNLEAIYREKLVKVEAENAMEQDEEIARHFPYGEMAKYDWIPATRNSKEKVLHLRKYFEVVELSLLGNNQITRIACRRLAITKKSDLALMAWAQRAKVIARGIDTEPINVKGLINKLDEIRSMTLMSPEQFCPRLKALLSECGIALVFLPHLKGSFLHGATFMDGNKIVLGLTARGSDADRFWFCLFHELGHIILGHIGNADGTTELDEADADVWSRDQLIPADAFGKFIEHKAFSSEMVIAFAETMCVAPGVVVGRLQNEGAIKHNMLNELKEHYVIAG